MLVLTRKINEGVLVDGHLVQVLSISGGRVRLGIEAPRDVPVVRSELAQRVQLEAGEAA